MSFFSRFFRKAPPSPPAPEKPRRPSDSPAVASPPPLERARVAAREEEALKAAIENTDGETIARFVVTGTSTKVRQLAAQAIEDPVRLRELIREVRGGNDKSVYKILTTKRDALLVQERKTEHLHTEISAVSAAIERHSHRAYDPLFSPTLDQLESRWRAVASDAAPQVVQKVQEAIDRSREVIAQHLRQVAAEASRQLAAHNAAAEAARLHELEEKAHTAAVAERVRIQEEQRRAAAETQEAQALIRRQIGGLIRKALGALHEGSTGRAAGLRKAIEAKLAGAPPLPAWLASQLQQLDTRLHELEDWKTFSVGPKRAELIEEMESLVGSTLDPPVLAERIKALQADWRTLSKGAGENLESDWQRFQEAAQQAFQPCREYFQAQTLVRAENLRRRETLLQRLIAFESEHNWEQPDWRRVGVALRESKQEWRQHSPVDRAAGKSLQEQFAAVTAKLQSRLDAEHAGNVRQKKSLIERAQQLHGDEDSRAAIDAVKELQRKWKEVGPVPRDEDHRLWEEFRQHCDAVFQRRQQEFAEYAAGLEDNRSRAVALCAQLEQIAALSGPQLLEQADGIGERRAAFTQLGEFPRGVARELHNRFERALERCEESFARQKARDTEQSWSDLLDVANKVRAYRLARLRATGEPEQAGLRQAALERLDSVSRWPKGGLEAVRGELDNPGGGDLGANEKALRMLCIRAEIFADAPTPPQDQPLRRQYQVERLVKSMGQGITSDAAQLDALALEWIRVGPTDEAVYAPLLERFRRCRPQL
jgi:Domain of Unknown Function (DUF349)